MPRLMSRNPIIEVVYPRQALYLAGMRTHWMAAFFVLTLGLAWVLKRPLGVCYRTAWLMHHKLMQVMADREEHYVLAGKVQVDDAYLGGERTGGKVGRGSENKVPLVAAVSLTEEDYPLRVRLTPVAGFTNEAVSAWAKDHIAPGSAVFSDGLACFGAVTEAGCTHHATVMAGRKPKEVPEFKWINTVLGNLKTSFSGCYHGFDFKKYAARYLAAFCYRFNRRFNLRTLRRSTWKSRERQRTSDVRRPPRSRRAACFVGVGARAEAETKRGASDTASSHLW